MKNLGLCRRTFIAAIGIAACLVLGIYTQSPDVGTPIAMIAMGLAAANAHENASKSKAAATYQNPE